MAQHDLVAVESGHADERTVSGHHYPISKETPPSVFGIGKQHNVGGNIGDVGGPKC